MKTRGLNEHMVKGNGTIIGAHLKVVEIKETKKHAASSTCYWVVTVQIPKDQCDANQLADCRRAPVNVAIVKSQAEMGV